MPVLNKFLRAPIKFVSVSRKGLDLNGVLFCVEYGSGRRFVLASSLEPAVMKGHGIEDLG